MKYLRADRSSEVTEATDMLGITKESRMQDVSRRVARESKEDVPMDKDSKEGNSPGLENRSMFLSEMDKEYIQALMKLDYRQEARRLIDEAYSKIKREPDTLLTQVEYERFRKMVDQGEEDDAGRLLEDAYDRAKSSQDSFLSPLDKEYIDLLQEMGAREDAKKILDSAREAFEDRKRERQAHLLTKLDQEYVDYLMELGQREKARKAIDDIYLNRRTQNEILADFMT